MLGGFACVGQVGNNNRIDVIGQIVVGLHRGETQKLRLGGFGVDHRNDLHVALKPAYGGDLGKIRTSGENDAGKSTRPGELDDR